MEEEKKLPLLLEQCNNDPLKTMMSSYDRVQIKFQSKNPKYNSRIEVDAGSQPTPLSILRNCLYIESRDIVRSSRGLNTTKILKSGDIFEFPGIGVITVISKIGDDPSNKEMQSSMDNDIITCSVVRSCAQC